MDKVTVQKRGWYRRLLAFIGPAYLISVGYMDPGNWATDIEGFIHGETVASVHHRVRIPLLIVPTSGTEPALHPF